MGESSLPSCALGERSVANVAAPSGRRLNLAAVPKQGTPIVSIDLDLTLACNLRCVYCFKEKDGQQMSKQVAFDAIVWLLYASGRAKKLRVNLMGGEPLLRFDLIRHVVPFAKRRAACHGKEIHFSVTTNNTLVSDEIVAFWKQWGLGFHCSLDGIPMIQDRNRPMADGSGSSQLAEQGVAKILAYRPRTTARCTVVPDSAPYILRNYDYFRSLGYVDIAMVPGDAREWSEPSIGVFEEQFREVADRVRDAMRSGVFIRVKGIDDYCEGEARRKPREFACGAGRGMALIDVHGGIWPCHRWNKQGHQSWRMGSIYEDFCEAGRAPLDVRSQTEFVRADCASCSAARICGGGCLAENLEENGDVYVPHPNKCALNRAWARVGEYFHDTLYTEHNETFMKRYYPPPGSQDQGQETAEHAAH